MLYVTTQSAARTFPASQTLSQNSAPDGGQFIPQDWPVLSPAEIAGLKGKSFGQNVADMLNLFFDVRMDGWDVDFSVGRYPMKAVSMSHRITVAEIWNNPDWSYSRFVRILNGRLRGTEDTLMQPTAWAEIAIRIATLFAVVGELTKSHLTDERKIDLSVDGSDLVSLMAAWYARKMGLPIGSIVFGCSENSPVWEFVHNGILRCDQMKQEESEISGTSLERLVHITLGRREASRLRECLENRLLFELSEDQFRILKRGIFAAVVGNARVSETIGTVFRSGTYLLSPRAALSFGALQDYRALSGETGNAVIISEVSPSLYLPEVSAALGIPEQELKERFHFA